MLLIPILKLHKQAFSFGEPIKKELYIGLQVDKGLSVYEVLVYVEFYVEH